MARERGPHSPELNQTQKRRDGEKTSNNRRQCLQRVLLASPSTELRPSQFEKTLAGTACVVRVSILGCAGRASAVSVCLSVCLSVCVSAKRCQLVGFGLCVLRVLRVCVCVCVCACVWLNNLLASFSRFESHFHLEPFASHTAVLSHHHLIQLPWISSHLCLLPPRSC